MGNGFSQLFPCFSEANSKNRPASESQPDVAFDSSEPLDETLGHSFCYLRSSARFLSPTPSDRFLSPTHSLRFSPSHEAAARARTGLPETGFKAISGASVSANTSTARTVHHIESIYDDASDGNVLGGVGAGCGNQSSVVNGFESTSSFYALPLQPVQRTGEQSGPIERGGFFMSGPIERGAVSGPLDGNTGSDGGRVHFSAPLGGPYIKRKRKKSISGIRKAFSRNLSEKKRPWVVPVLNFVGRKEAPEADDGGDLESKNGRADNVQWALGKAGEDRVHVVVSEEHGWLFVGIYDGFNGPDAPEFLMVNLYRAVFNALEGLFWDVEESSQTVSEHEAANAASEDVLVVEESNLSIGISGGEDGNGEREATNAPIVEESNPSIGIAEGEIGTGQREAANVASGDVLAVEEINASIEIVVGGEVGTSGEVELGGDESNPQLIDRGTAKRVTFQPEQVETRRRRLWELLAEDDPEDGLDLSGSERFAFSVDDALSVNNAGSAVSRRWLLLTKLKQGLLKHKEGHGKTLFPWKFGLEDKEKVEVDNKVEEKSRQRVRKRKVGPIDHELVLRALCQALEVTERAYLDMTDKLLDQNPELALMGSCLLVVLMRDEDVYVMNLGDSRAIVAQYEDQEIDSSMESKELVDNGSSMEGIIEESTAVDVRVEKVVIEPPVQATKLTALQLSTDHSTSIEEEIIRIKMEHPDDSKCIVNGRVKGRLKVTRAFGAGSLKQPKLNDALLEMFRNEYIGTKPYVSCIPSLCHHKLCPRDQFLVLSSDGLYQYLTNEEVVSHVERFMAKYPEGDPAQHLIEEVLFRAAKKAGMLVHELLDIPQGDRRKYHDDVTVMVISLEGRIWKSSGKYL